MDEQAQLSIVNFTKDAYITIEGVADTNRFFIISSGRVHVSRKIKDVPEEGDKLLGPGDFFGVVSAMSSQLRMETSKALTDVTLIAVKHEQYPLLIQKNAALAIKIVMYISKMMRKFNEAYTKVSTRKVPEIVNDPDQLYKIAEYYKKQGLYDHALYAYTQYIKHCPEGSHVTQAGIHIAKIASYTRTAKHEVKLNEAKRVYPKGTLVFCESEPGKELFIIQSGSIKITRISENKEVVLAVLTAGDIFGEMSLLESMPRAANAIANEDCSVMVISRDNFTKMIETQPQLITKLTILIAERLWLSYHQIKNHKIHDPQKRIYDMLKIHLGRKHISAKETRPFTFDFGPKELIEMIGLPGPDGQMAVKKFLESRTVKVVEGKLHILDTHEVFVKS